MTDLDKLLELLAESKREHDHCEDAWYCCRACRECRFDSCQVHHFTEVNRGHAPAKA